jgi:hypothetical protein
MTAKITITGVVEQIRRVKTGIDSPPFPLKWICLDITTGGTGSAPKGLPMPSQDIHFTVLINKTQYDELNRELNKFRVKLVGSEVLIQGEITLDLSFDVIQGDMGIVAFEVESLEVNKKREAALYTETAEAPKVMKVDSIQISQEYQKLLPSEQKILKAIQYYEEHGSLDQEILLVKAEAGWVLCDGYTRYLAAKRLGLDEVSVAFQGHNAN